MMKKIILVLFPVVLSIISCSKDGSTTVKPQTPVEDKPKSYTFESSPAWQDEFDTDGAPDASKWGFDLGGDGWGNNELEYYTNDNAIVKSGILNIVAAKQAVGGREYTSSRMVSKTGSDMLYGRIEVKAKLPAGTGTWPAIWMLPNDYAYGAWPNSGEIDIMEHVGFDPGVVHFSVHNQLYHGTSPKSGSVTIPTVFNEYHIYRTDWTPESIKGFYDDKLVFTYANNGRGSAGWPYDQPFHILLNLAIGGDWGGAKGVDDSIFPVTMQVDYVRFYKMITK